MTKQDIFQQIRKKKSYLCVGLDPDLNKFPKIFEKSPDSIFDFNKEIIDATKDLAIAYKPNLAFYEIYGSKGWDILAKTAEYIKSNFPEIFLIADAKRGDIGNTSTMYAKAFFETLPFDAITLSPYMGSDSLSPFLEFEGKWAIILSLTSNKGAEDFQYLTSNSGKIHEVIIEKSSKLADDNKLMYVVGATKSQFLQNIRWVIPNHFLLVPGVGSQGGSLKEVSINGLNSECGLIVNSSRGILYASSNSDFQTKAHHSAELLRAEMEIYLKQHELI